MVRLLLLRHAKAEPAEPGMTDRERPLAPRGERDAGLVGAAIAARGLLPDLILCSPSERTRGTLAALAGPWPAEIETEFLDELYEPPGDYRAAIAGHGSSAKRLLVVGHNPAIQATALALVGGGEDADRRALARKYPTGGLATIEFPDASSWRKLTPQSGRLLEFLSPASLGGGPED